MKSCLFMTIFLSHLRCWLSLQPSFNSNNMVGMNDSLAFNPESEDKMRVWIV